jgi:outer membrane protein assembly factor BamB
MKRWTWSLLCVACALWCACGEDEEATPSDTSDTGQDTAQDVPEDTAQDVPEDTAQDAPEDMAQDAPEDMGDGLPPLLPRVPLQPESPWPKFRADPAQTGRTSLQPTDDGAALWAFPTGKGIFSSPIIGADGTVYVGSANRSMYALKPDGTQRWSFQTGEIIDSAAVLDDQGGLYFGSGDGNLYALDAATGQERWRFQADDPAGTGAFIRWFEGNVTLGLDGSLYAGNDNFYFYALDRETGALRWRFRMPDQTWSLAAVDETTGNLYVGNNNLTGLSDNLFALDRAGRKRWSGAASDSTAAASPTLTPDGLVVLGGFDGYVHAYDAATGQARWAFATRDHIYSSPALAQDGALIQPSADGTVYALDPLDGSQRWAFDWGAPIRSSPAVDGHGNIYMGTGDGHLLVLNADGTLRWALRLINDDRDDLNASPAVGAHAVYLAGESGEVFGVPYDFCLRPAEQENPRCVRGPAEALPQEDARMLFTTRFGSTLPTPPEAIDPHAPLAFSLSVRRGGDTRLALVDAASLVVEVTPPQEVQVELSADARFLTVLPLRPLVAGEDGRVSMRLAGDWLEDPEREGLRFSGGTRAGSFETTFSFSLTPAAPGPLPLPTPAAPGDPSAVWEFSRLAAPLPTLLPSYNQIGFDSLHYLIGMVEGDGERGVAWLVEATPTPADPTRVAAVPGTRGIFPFEVAWRDGEVAFVNADGLALEVLNVAIPFDTFRVTGRLDAQGDAVEPVTVHATTVCGQIPLYGPFLRELGLCNPDSDVLLAYGAALLRAHEGGVQQAPQGVGGVTFALTERGVEATLEGSALRLDEHSLAVLLVDADSGSPVSLDYGPRMVREADAQGRASRVALPLRPGDVLPARVRAYLMVDAYPAARAELDLP